jgi:hypothetical protein
VRQDALDDELAGEALLALALREEDLGHAARREAAGEPVGTEDDAFLRQSGAS